MLGVVRNASAVLTDLTLSVGEMGTAETRLSNYLGISTKEIQSWTNAANIADVSASALTNDISALETKLARIAQGEVPQGLAEAMGKLGIPEDLLGFADMSQEDRVKMVFGAAGTMEDQTNAADLVGQILGSSFKDLYTSGVVQREGFEGLWARANNANFTNSDTAKQGDIFNTELKTFETSIENMGKLLGGEIAGELVPLLNDINNWLDENGEEIATTLEKLGTDLGDITGGLVGAVGALLVGDFDKAGKYLMQLGEGTNSILNDPVGIFKDTKSGYKDAGAGAVEAIGSGILAAGAGLPGVFGKVAVDTMSFWDNLLGSNYAEQAKFLASATKEEKEAYFKILGIYNSLTKGMNRKQKEFFTEKWKKAITNGDDIFHPVIQDSLRGQALRVEDGIIKPNGEVVQVAPDDWVFAARNLGDMAKAFVPYSFGGGKGSSELVINQNITVNGGHDMPQTIRQQARLGLADALQQATKYSQVMPAFS